MTNISIYYSVQIVHYHFKNQTVVTRLLAYVAIPCVMSVEKILVKVCINTCRLYLYADN
jgi:hypothetical protein